MYDISKNYEIARSLATGGIILLKNEDNVLPLNNKSRVGVVGKNCLSLLKGGGGSSQVKCEYVRSLEYGLIEKANQKKFNFYEASLEIAAQTGEYTTHQLNELSKNFDTAIVTVKRHSFEGGDRKIGKNIKGLVETGAYVGETDDSFEYQDYENKVGYYYPSSRELMLFKHLEESEIKNVVLILNISTVVDISYIQKFEKIKSVLLVYMPGMESGTAIADVLCGDVNPSGRLVDTIAYDIYDYPSTEYFDYDEEKTEYKEGIFVGYRYFETKAKDKVLFPFGFGLSYTDFEFSNQHLVENNGKITVTVDVKNIGAVSGREVVQVYTSSPEGALPKPVLELRGFEKTGEIAPGKTVTVTVEFNVNDMASFDHIGDTGHKGAWVLEAGEYKIYVAKNVRDTYLCGTYVQKNTEAVKQLKTLFDGSDFEYTLPKRLEPVNCEKLTLYDVADGKCTLSEFIAQLTVDELLKLSMGQPPTFPHGTAGIGNLKNYLVPNAQTADGPAGVRRSINSTCFPCETLIAASWDKQLQYEMGKAMGEEAYSTGIDVILAPGLNIHRSPLCGRNFEYFSEDPLVSGRSAANIVNGIQAQGLCATIKHFAANNCEFMRRSNNSIVDERTLREIYLKGFEIAIRESNPAYVMSSYNKLNGQHTSANISLLRGILRDEWGYEGCVMTDWRNYANLDDEIIAGNNIKMPCGYFDQIALAKKAYFSGKLPLEVLQENAKWVLMSVMKTRAFKMKEFGIKHVMTDKKLCIEALDAESFSSTRVMQSRRDDSSWYLHNLNLDQRKQRTFLNYWVHLPSDGEYRITAEFSTDNPDFEIWYGDDQNEKIAVALCSNAVIADQWYKTETVMDLKQGENFIKVTLAGEPNTEYEPLTKQTFPALRQDIKLANFKFELIS